MQRPLLPMVDKKATLNDLLLSMNFNEAINLLLHARVQARASFYGPSIRLNSKTSWTFLQF